MKRINLIPPEHATKPILVPEHMWRWQAMGLAAAFLISASIYYGAGHLQLARLKQDVADLQAQRSALISHQEQIGQSMSQVQAQLMNAEKRYEVLQSRRDEIEMDSPRMFQWSEALLALQKSTPSKVWIEELKMSLDQSRILGGAHNNQQVSNFINAMNQSHYFRNVTFLRIEAGEVESKAVVHFELGFDLVQHQGSIG